MKRTVVITGASSGIGAACTKAFAKKGFQLVLGARRLEKLENMRREIEEETGALETFGRVDILINNAGLAKGKNVCS